MKRLGSGAADRFLSAPRPEKYPLVPQFIVFPLRSVLEVTALYRCSAFLGWLRRYGRFLWVGTTRSRMEFAGGIV